MELLWCCVCLLYLVLPSQQAGDLDIYSMHVTSDVTYRYASTQVVSRVANRGTQAQEAKFLIQLPDKAFISNFSMEIDGKIYPASVKEKEQAKKIYQRAKKKGQSAGHVTQKSRDARIFKIAVNVAAESKVTFNLTYQELLTRRFGMYEHVIYIDPGQVVNDMQIVVNINELKKLTVLKVPPLRPLKDNLQNQVTQQEHSLARINKLSPTRARISYQPTAAQQKDAGADGITGKFIVQYDVERAMDGGEIYVVDGYFVHYFAPPLQEESVPNKNIVFILDTSGSMGGDKIRQLKEAMQAILRQLREGDHFNIILFSSGSNAMFPGTMITFNSTTVKKAQRFVSRISAGGGTNINRAILDGLQLLRSVRNGLPNLMIFLTDGDPTSGVTNPEKIVTNIRQANTKEVTLFSLGFGSGVKFDLLKKLSLQNNGFARKIYAESDAALQLRNFYDEVGTPLLSGVDIKYLGKSVAQDSVTKNDNDILFKGSEIVVAGRLNDLHSNVISQVHAVSGEGKLTLNQTAPPAPSDSRLAGVTERLWAYITIRQILDNMVEETDPTKKAALKQKALQLSLKYHFVTPVTSMVVVKPETEDKKQGDVPTTPAAVTTVAPTPAPTRPPTPHPTRRSGYKRRHYGTTGADNDPHFMVSLGANKVSVCFDVMGKPGDIFLLIQDGAMTVNGLIVPGTSANKTGDSQVKMKTYFGKIGIIYDGNVLIIHPHKIVFKGCNLKWRTSSVCYYGGLTVEVTRKRSVSVTYEGTTLTILRHRSSGILHLGFYVQDQSSLGYHAKGLIGSLRHYSDVPVIASANISAVPETTSAVLRIVQPSVSGDFSVKTIPVSAGHRRNMLLKSTLHCWFVHNNGRYLIGDYRSYKVKHLNKPDKKLQKKLKNKYFV